jgi:hypothetical protein
MGRFIFPIKKQKRISVNLHKLKSFDQFRNAHMEGTMIGCKDENKFIIYLDNMQKAYIIAKNRISNIRSFENIEWKPKDKVEVKQEVHGGLFGEYNWWNATIVKRIDKETYRIRWKQQYILDDGSEEPIECNVNKINIRSGV